MSKKSSITTGKQYGNLTVLQPKSSHYYEPNGRKLYKTLVKCSCGYKFEIKSFNLTRGQSSKCPKCVALDRAASRSIKIGDVFDNLTVVGFTRKYSNVENGRLLAVCKCKCGNEKIKRIDTLKSVDVQSCGCMPAKNCVMVGKLYRCFYNEIKSKAKSRNIWFKLTMKELWQMYEQQNGKCALSGLDIEFANKAKLPNTASLDRIDSSKDYTLDNVQWVHKDIQKMKMDLPQERFVELCKLISDSH